MLADGSTRVKGERERVPLRYGFVFKPFFIFIFFNDYESEIGAFFRVTFNEIQCLSFDSGVVWSNQLEIKGFGGRWDFGIDIVGGKGYVMTR